MSRVGGHVNEGDDSMKTEKTEPNEGVGAKIRELRKKLDKKQATLAAAAGMSAAQLCHVERGLGRPTLRTLERIAVALEVEVAELFKNQAGGSASDADDTTRERLPAGGDTLSSDALENGRNTVDTGSEPYGALSPALCATSLSEGGGHANAADSVMAIEPESGLLYVHDPRDAAVDRRVRARLAKEIKEWKKVEKAAGVEGCPTLPLRYPAAAEFGALMARQMRTAGGLGPTAVVDPVAFFTGKGVRVLETKLPFVVDSWSLWDPEDGNAFVFLRKGTTAERKRFRIAYEMAHVARFVTGGCRATIRDIRASRRISRAFAAAFLLPEEAVREAAHVLAVGPSDWTWELTLVAKDGFGVSTDTFLYRIEELGMIPHTQARALRARLKAHYAACRAEGRTDFEPHTPRRASSRLGALHTRAESNKAGL